MGLFTSSEMGSLMMNILLNIPDDKYEKWAKIGKALNMSPEHAMEHVLAALPVDKAVHLAKGVSGIRAFLQSITPS